MEVSSDAAAAAFFGAAAVAAADVGASRAFPAALPAAWTAPGAIVSAAVTSRAPHAPASTRPIPRSLHLIARLLYPALLSR
jgi:hypothetical protein